MKIKKTIVIVTAAILTAAGAWAMGPPPGKGSNKVWAAPVCTQVSGLASTSFTTDAGATWTTNTDILSMGQLTTGIVALEAANTMLAEFQGSIYRSQDAGCSWKSYGSSPVSTLRLVPGVGQEAYGFGFFKGPGIFYLNGKANPRTRFQQRQGLPDDVVGLAVDPADGLHLRAVVDSGQVYESLDGSVSKWGTIGTRAPIRAFTYFAEIDRSNLDHIVVGTVTDGVWTTLNGGATWQQATGLSSCSAPECTPRTNSFNGVISPADGNVVYVMSLDLNESDAGAPSRGRHIYRSDDGGLSFRIVLDEGGEIVLPNGPTMAAHPTDADLLYFSFGSKQQYPGGINLYTYDDVSGQTTWNTSPDYFEIRSFTFNPADPGVIYVGFEG